MTAALADTRDRLKPILENWARWNQRGMPPLGYGRQWWQRWIRSGRPPPPPPEVDENEAQWVERCYVYLREYHPREMFVVKVYWLDNFNGERMSREDMRRDAERKFDGPCSMRTFDRHRARGETLLAQCLGMG